MRDQSMKAYGIIMNLSLRLAQYSDSSKFSIVPTIINIIGSNTLRLAN